MQRVTLFAGTLPLAYTDTGKGTRTFLLLHGGAGPRSVKSLADMLVTHGYRVITPVHPGFDNEPRPAYLASVISLTTAYLALLDQLAVNDVIVAGNSLGGWIGVEMASRSPSRISGFVVMDGVGIDTEGTSLTILNPVSLPIEQRGAAIWHDPSKNTMTPPQDTAGMAARVAAVAAYSGVEHFCYDPTLRSRLALGGVSVPVLVLWGESDRIVTLEYGRRLVEALGKHARLEVIERAGHLPHVEQPDATLKAIVNFAQQTPAVTSHPK